MAAILRILLLCSVAWLAGLTAPLFTLLGHPTFARDLVLIAVGLFLLGKATYEIHQRLEGEEGHAPARVRPSLASVLVQVAW